MPTTKKAGKETHHAISFYKDKKREGAKLVALSPQEKVMAALIEKANPTKILPADGKGFIRIWKRDHTAKLNTALQRFEVWRDLEIEYWDDHFLFFDEFLSFVKANGLEGFDNIYSPDVYRVDQAIKIQLDGIRELNPNLPPLETLFAVYRSILEEGPRLTPPISPQLVETLARRVAEDIQLREQFRNPKNDGEKQLAKAALRTRGLLK